MRISIKLWLSALVAAAAVVAMQTAGAVELQEADALPPAFLQKAVGPMAKSDTALRRLLGEFLAHRERGDAGPFAPSNLHLQYAPGRVVIDAVAAGDPARLMEDLRGLGLTKAAQYGPVVSGLIPIGAIERMTRLDSVRAVGASWRPMTNAGLVTSEGVYVMGADFVTQTGLGQTIGVLSDSFDHLGDAGADQTNGDLPASVISLDDSANCGSILVQASCRDEGRAMMQLAHDVAPGASMAFHTAFTGEANFAQGIRDLAVAGADIIVDDVMYFAETMFQDGIIAQAVDDVVADGVAYFSAAGNGARKSYEASYEASGEPLFVVNWLGQMEPRGELHDFDPGPDVDWRQSMTIPAGATIYVSLQWDQPSSAVAAGNGSRSDVDLYLQDGNSVILASSIDDNITSGVPVEILAYTNSGETEVNLDLMIAHFDGPEAALMKYVLFGGLNVTVEHATDSPTLYGHANAAGAEAVGAAFYQDTPLYDTSLSQPVLEYFSSAGGVPILFDRNGLALSAAELREKPEIVGPDGTNTTFFYADSTRDTDNWPNFFGTSAAAPHVAAVAALMREANPAATPTEIYAALESTATDMMSTGFDWDSGYGFVSAPDAVAVVAGSGPTDPPSVNHPPVADAGEDKTVTLSDTIIVPLAGSGSDLDVEDSLTFQWTLVSKPRKSRLTSGDIVGADSSSAVFHPDKAGTYEFQLTVSDGIASSSDTTVVTVEKPPKTGGGGDTGGCNP
ncbi:MAG: S8 family serine peptidase, partial [Proteobacteria bacterium]|nr:S8 family serine peptidase [Pseudomonadota bacterium]